MEAIEVKEEVISSDEDEGKSQSEEFLEPNEVQPAESVVVKEEYNWLQEVEEALDREELDMQHEIKPEVVDIDENQVGADSEFVDIESLASIRPGSARDEYILPVDAWSVAESSPLAEERFSPSSSLTTPSIVAAKPACGQCGERMMVRDKSLPNEATCKCRVWCGLCSRAFDHRHYLEQHLRVVHRTNSRVAHNVGSYVCPTCGTSFLSRTSLQGHVMAAHPLRCHICSRCFSSQEAMENHLQNIHGEGDQPVATDMAATAKTEATSMAATAKTEATGMAATAKTEATGMAAAAKTEATSMAAAAKTEATEVVDVEDEQEEEENAYKCFICPETFAVMEDFVQHLCKKHGRGEDKAPPTTKGVVPTSSLLFACAVCQMKFSTKDLVSQHIHEAHPNNLISGGRLLLPQPPGVPGPPAPWGAFFHCEPCQRLFLTKKDIEDHYKSHHSYKGREYGSPVATVLSVGAPPMHAYACSACSEQFVKLENARKHVRHVHGAPEGEFACSTCRETFPTRAAVGEHMKAVHPGMAVVEHLQVARPGMPVMSNVKRTEQFTCGQCLQVFASSAEALRHVHRVHNTVNTAITLLGAGVQTAAGSARAQFGCSYCAEVFTTKEAAVEHIRLAHGAAGTSALPANNSASPVCQFKCTQCSKMFESSEMAVRHVRNAHPLVKTQQLATDNSQAPSRFTCNQCFQQFPTNESAVEHVATAHLAPPQVQTGMGPPYLVCAKCTQSFSTSEAAMEHVKSNHPLIITSMLPGRDTRASGMFKCSECLRSFPSNEAALEHLVMTHLMLPPVAPSKPGFVVGPPGRDPEFACSTCMKRFVTNQAALEHIQQEHGNSKPLPTVFKCAHCQEVFTHQTDATEHVRTAHCAKQTKCYQCNNCNKFFTTENAIAEHMKRVHNTPSAGAGPAIVPNLHQLTQNMQRMSNDMQQMASSMWQLTGNPEPLNAAATAVMPMPVTAPKPEIAARSTAAAPVVWQQPSEAKVMSNSGQLVVQPQRVTVTNSATGTVFLCSLCRLTFTSREAVTEHIRSHNKVSMFQCTACQKKFVTRELVELHIRIEHTPGKKDSTSAEPPPLAPLYHKCCHCSQVFSDGHSISKHMAEAHKSSSKPLSVFPKFQCGTCRKVFVSEDSVINHQCRSTSVPSWQLTPRGRMVECPGKFRLSPKIASTANRLVTAAQLPQSGPLISNRTTESKQIKPHEQPRAGTSGMSQVEPSENMRSHNLSCKLCKMTFWWPSELRRHMEMHKGRTPHYKLHRNTGNVPQQRFECKPCNRTFYDKRHLLAHQRCHGTGTFLCEDCGRSFVLKAHLAVHKLRGRCGKREELGKRVIGEEDEAVAKKSGEEQESLEIEVFDKDVVRGEGEKDVVCQKDSLSGEVEVVKVKEGKDDLSVDRRATLRSRQRIESYKEVDQKEERTERFLRRRSFRDRNKAGVKMKKKKVVEMKFLRVMVERVEDRVCGREAVEEEMVDECEKLQVDEGGEERDDRTAAKQEKIVEAHVDANEECVLVEGVEENDGGSGDKQENIAEVNIDANDKHGESMPETREDAEGGGSKQEIAETHFNGKGNDTVSDIEVGRELEEEDVMIMGEGKVEKKSEKEQEVELEAEEVRGKLAHDTATVGDHAEKEKLAKEEAVLGEVCGSRVLRRRTRENPNTEAKQKSVDEGKSQQRKPRSKQILGSGKRQAEHVEGEAAKKGKTTEEDEPLLINKGRRGTKEEKRKEKEIVGEGEKQESRKEGRDPAERQSMTNKRRRIK